MPRLSLDFHLARARRAGNTPYIEYITDLRCALYDAMMKYDWHEYNRIAHLLNEQGATIPDHPVPVEFPQEDAQMGMFDKQQYLTGSDNPFVEAGDTFYLHNARIDGTVRVGGVDKPQAKLLVSHEREGEKVAVYTAGAAIVNQVKRMDASDRTAMAAGMHVRLDQVPSKQGSPTNVLTPADQEPPTGATTASNGDDF